MYPPSPSLTAQLTRDEWDGLDYLPFILTKKGLFGFFIINCGIMGGLVTFQQKPAFIVSTPSYYALIASLILLGTATVAHLEAILLNLSRMTPFILCAREQGATAAETILRSYFPAPGLRDAWETKSWLLVFAYIIYYPSYAVIGLKSALLYESASSTDPYLHVNDWACYTLLVFYSIVQLYLLAIAAYLWKRPTGLRWDPVSIADILVLFRHCNFLNNFEGSSIADRQSMIQQLGDIRLHLRYWKRENGDFWHGFGTVASDTRKISMISMKELALIRYNSAWSVANPVSVYVHFTLAFLLMILFILGVSITPELTPNRSYCWKPSGLSRSHANLILDVVLTSVVGVLSDFWASLSIFVAHTEPLAQMASPKGGPAKHTLLLNYTSSFLPVKIYDAFRNRHWKLVRVVLWELIQRSFPTLVGTSIVVYSGYSGESSSSCVICFSMPLFIVVIVGLAACAGSIVYELLLASVFRRTPRDYLSIADIVSWSSTSSLLHPAATDNAPLESPLADPLHVEVEGEKSKRWYMQHRLELQLSRFRLGYAKVPNREYYAFGITDKEPERLPAVRPTHLARRLEVVESTLGEEECLAKELEIVVGNGSISYDKLVSASENTMVTHDDGNIVNLQHQNEQEQPEEGN
ncbi:hypothetical protein CDEST_01750 [Colletotrichum destructivum]|uniref:Phosphoribosylaminoimidazole-succinocarboxamide synthase n=1 Tax=Colletotrichum destructivum TaxID=34406 RepID=A0AAX4I0Y4_9PEZI|nr:hypothetical protein CDEST_01750 [Colletotrichum destructivum]